MILTEGVLVVVYEEGSQSIGIPCAVGIEIDRKKNPLGIVSSIFFFILDCIPFIIYKFTSILIWYILENYFLLFHYASKTEKYHSDRSLLGCCTGQHAALLSCEVQSSEILFHNINEKKKKHVKLCSCVHKT